MRGRLDHLIYALELGNEVQDIFTIFGLLKFDFLDLGSFRAATAGSINYGTSVG